MGILLKIDSKLLDGALNRGNAFRPWVQARSSITESFALRARQNFELRLINARDNIMT
jgi:hypothetical protein